MFEQKLGNIVYIGCCEESISSGNENAILELSSYWELVHLWPCNTPTASLFVTCWMFFESETIGEDLLLTSSFSEHLIVDLPRLNPLWDCRHRDLEYWVYICSCTNTHTDTKWAHAAGRKTPFCCGVTFYTVKLSLIWMNPGYYKVSWSECLERDTDVHMLDCC